MLIFVKTFEVFVTCFINANDLICNSFYIPTTLRQVNNTNEIVIIHKMRIFNSILNIKQTKKKVIFIEVKSKKQM